MWGIEEDENFLVESGGLTENFDDNSRLAIIRQADIFLLYVKYTKGTEDRAEISMAYCPNQYEDFFEESIVVTPFGNVSPFYHVLEQSGAFRLALPTAVREIKVKVSVRGKGTAPFTGNLELIYSTNNLRP